MNKIKLFTPFIVLMISTSAFTQKKFTTQFIMQPGNSFVVGQWRNFSAYNAPSFQRKLTPSMETGVNAIYNFGGKAGSKVVYDEMYQSGFYLADKITISTGIFYSFRGQSYKDMRDIIQPNNIWSRKLRLQYLKIPLKFDFIKGKENELQLVYTAGFYAAYLTFYKEKNSIIRDTNQTVIVTKGSFIDTTFADGTSVQYKLDNKPYQPVDYGMSLGVGMQKKLNSDWTIQFLLIGQIGFTDIKNTSAQYSDGLNLNSYFEANSNGIIPHKISSLELVVGLKKTFEWTPAPTKERKRFRIFRLKQ